LVPYLLGPATGGVMTREQLVATLTLERFTHTGPDAIWASPDPGAALTRERFTRHRRADNSPIPRLPLPVETVVDDERLAAP
jgi:hypothetical protein